MAWLLALGWGAAKGGCGLRVMAITPNWELELVATNRRPPPAVPAGMHDPW